MFVKHDPQMSLFQAHLMFQERLRKQMENSWAHVFRHEIMPLIAEEPFRDLYCPDNGAPNFPVRILVALSTLKELLCLRDSDLIDAFHFNALFHYAMALAPGERTLAVRTLYNFRSRVAGDETISGVFQTVTDAILKIAQLCPAFQRIDSTQITSNMANLSRLGLFVRTIEAFLKRLGRTFPQHLAGVPEELGRRYRDRSGYFCDPRGSESRRSLEQAARDLSELLCRFEGEAAVRASKAYGLLARLFAEQCRVEQASGSDPIVVLKDPKEVSSGSLQNPSDPDATYNAHKGKGYKVQLSETCTPENPFQVLTAVALQPANEGDQKALVPLLEETKARGCGPETAVADTQYGGAENLLAAAERGVELLSPTPGTADPDDLTLMNFALEGEPPSIQRCPQGHTPVKRRALPKREGETLWFDPSICERCELCASCPAGQNKGRLTVTDNDLLIAWNRAREKTEEFKKAYKARSGIESTNSELKEAHDLARVWCRGWKRVSFAVFFKALACNIKRFAQWRCAQRPRIAAATLAMATAR
jgi:hypothetical protein